MISTHRVLVHAHPHHDGGRQIGQGLRQPSEGALGQVSHGMLILGQAITHIRPVRLHGDVVGRIQNPKQAGRHPQRRAVRHHQQAQGAQHRADEEIRCASAPARCGSVTHGPHDGLNQQTRDRPGQGQQRQHRFICTQIAVDRAHIALLQAKAELQTQEANVHLHDLPNGQAR